MNRLRGSSWFTSLLVHVALALVIMPAVIGTRRVATFFGIEFSGPDKPYVATERVRFVQVAEPKREVVINGRDKVRGGEAAPPAPVAPPTDVPVAVPDPDAAARTADGVNRDAKGDGSGGPLVGITPSFSDPRIWNVPWGPPGADDRPTYEAVRSRIEELVRQGQLPRAYEDSIAKIYGMVAERRPGDWTMQGPNGERWGIDGGFIRLGKVAIPTVLLALLPLNTGQINVQQMENQRRIGQMSADIRYQAQRAMNEDEFRAAVRRVRERKEREREEERKRREGQQAQSTQPVVPVQP